MLAQSLPPALSGRLRGGLHLHLCILHRTCVLCPPLSAKKKKKRTCIRIFLSPLFVRTVCYGGFLWSLGITYEHRLAHVGVYVPGYAFDTRGGGSKTPADLLIKALWTHVRSGCIPCLDGLLWLYPCEDTSPVFSPFDRENPPVHRQKRKEEKKEKNDGCHVKRGRPIFSVKG